MDKEVFGNLPPDGLTVGEDRLEVQGFPDWARFNAIGGKGKVNIS